MDQAPRPTTPTTSAFSALPAAGPHPEHADELLLFGQFVGDWDIDGVMLAADGTWEHHRAEWLFGWALEGRAIQDVLISPPRAGRGQNETTYEYGTTIRFYDPDTSTWKITYISPVTRAVHALVGGRVGNDIVLNGRRPDGALQRWSFSDIGPDAFRWQGHVSADDGATWVLDEEMHARRRRDRSLG